MRRASRDQFAAELDATRWREAHADVRILATHQTFESATCGPGNFRFRSGDDVVERDAVPAEFDYVAAGHIHRYQQLASLPGGGPQLVYAGSCDRVSFAEADEPKGYVLVEQHNGCLVPTFLEQPVRPMRICPVDVSGLTREQIAGHVEDAVCAEPENVVAQVRLSGRAPAATLRGLRLAARFRNLRPEALITLNAQSVEIERTPWRAEPVGLSTPALGWPPAPIARVRLTTANALPKCCGVYALFDASGRLLYVGKAKNVRLRVQTHLRGSSESGYFRGWTRQIAAAEVRQTDSELEALLLEAEAIRVLRPPFNRHMRRWQRYRYLSTGRRPYGQLEVTDRPTSGRECFGPYASRFDAEATAEAIAEALRLAACPDDEAPRKSLPLLSNEAGGRLCARYYAGVCRGPCAGRIGTSEYDALLRRRADLLLGRDDSLAVIAEQAAERCDDPGSTAASAQRRRAHRLRVAFERGRAQAEAEALRDGLLLLCGRAGGVKVLRLGLRGIKLVEINCDEAGAPTALQTALSRPPACAQEGRLASSIVDTLCLVARALRRPDAGCAFVPASEWPRRPLREWCVSHRDQTSVFKGEKVIA